MKAYLHRDDFIFYVSENHAEIRIKKELRTGIKPNYCESGSRRQVRTREVIGDDEKTASDLLTALKYLYRDESSGFLES